MLYSTSGWPIWLELIVTDGVSSGIWICGLLLRQI